MVSKVVFISAGLTEPKKGGNAFARHHLYLNYGLLGLASVVARQGYPVVLIHGRFDAPEIVAARVAASYELNARLPLFLSLPSVFAIPWARRFCASLKESNPDTRIVVGGRWVVGEDGAWVKSKIPGVDLVVYGTAEDRIIDLLSPVKWPFLPHTDLSTQKAVAPPGFPPLDHTLMPDYLDFQPVLEVSRGCGMGCSFCLEANVPLSDTRPVGDVVAVLEGLGSLYPAGDFHPYFEASFFRPPSPWIAEFRRAYRERGLSVNWRCETRVDAIPPEGFGELAAAGLKVVDLGLETASPTQIRRMSKSPKPDAYLKRASALLRECKASGIWAKVNVLLYAGETSETLSETLDWLDRHRDCIKGVSVNPLLVYGTSGTASEYLNSLRSHGAAPVDPQGLVETGYTAMHLSPEIDRARAEELVGTISKRYMSDRDYYDLKSFSYFPRSVTWEVFRRMAAESPPNELTFSTLA